MQQSDFVPHLLKCASAIESGGVIEGVILASTIKNITNYEQEEGGPYILTDSGELDFGLNIAIARFLALQDIFLPKLGAYIASARSENKISSLLIGDDLVGECISIYDSLLEKEVVSKKNIDKEELLILKQINSLSSKRLRGFSKEFKRCATDVVNRTILGNPDRQMSLMTLYVRQALGSSSGKRFTDEFLTETGLANVFFWTAFIIYDDFWDEDESANPKLLPVANLFARHYVNYFGKILPDKKGFNQFFHDLMDKLDDANEWEMQFCRAKVENGKFFIPETLPNYRDFSVKFYPAAGHILGPVAMLVKLGYDLDSKEVGQFIDYFKNYLIAMQLNDDVHDWKEDLERGHISTAVYLLLVEWKKIYPDREVIDLQSDIKDLEDMFLFKILEPISRNVISRTKRARKALNSLDIFSNPAPLERFIDRNESVANDALTNLEQGNELIQAFKSVQKS